MNTLATERKVHRAWELCVIGITERMGALRNGGGDQATLAAIVGGIATSRCGQGDGRWAIATIMDVISGCDVGSTTASGVLDSSVDEFIDGETVGVTVAGGLLGRTWRTAGGHQARNFINRLLGIATLRLIPVRIDVGARARFNRSDTDMASNDIGRRSFDSAWLRPVNGCLTRVERFHHATCQWLSHQLHGAAGHGFISCVVTNPADDSILRGPTSHQSIEVVVGSTGFDREIPTIVMFKLVPNR